MTSNKAADTADRAGALPFSGSVALQTHVFDYMLGGYLR
jgi:hypothetical protein